MLCSRTLAVIVALLFCTFGAYAEQYTWGYLPVGGGGYVTGIAIHPTTKDVMYIRTDVGGA